MSATNLSAVALSFLFRLVRRTIELLGVRRLSGLEKDVEIIVLRQQLQADTSSLLHVGRPGITRPCRGAPPQPSAVIVVRDTSHGALLATQDRPEALDLSPPKARASLLARQPRRADLPAGPRESPLCRAGNYVGRSEEHTSE